MDTTPLVRVMLPYLVWRIVNPHMLAETTVPYLAFKEAGFDVQFATETGKSPVCDRIMLEGLGQKILVQYLRENDVTYL